MKKIVFIIAFILSSLVQASSCYDAFIEENGIVDSKAFIVYNDKLEAEFEESPSEFVKEAIEEILPAELACSELFEKSDNKNLDGEFKIECAEIAPGKWHSKSCFAESKIGYFFINLDMMDNVHVIYNRWD